MCGITGIICFGDSVQEHANLSKAVYALRKRGPDAEGICYYKNVALGHRRLKILDLSNDANQPLTDKSGNFTIVFNGEIYNYQELKQSLIKKGVSFKTTSDTEVLLQLYIQHQEHCVNFLEGDFAFAILDRIKNKLFIARDRFGVKPLFYYSDSDHFAFSSSLNSLMQYTFPKHINKNALKTFLQFTYIPAPYSILENVYKLEAGCSIELPITHSNSFSLKKYYTLNENVSHSINYKDAKEEVKKLLTESVNQKLQADVKVATFLSGGLDSSIITALASKYKNETECFSIGYSANNYYDETNYAKSLTSRYQIRHHIFKLDHKAINESVEDVLNNLDEPFADSSALPFYFLSKQTAGYVKVALSGDGADELAGGYQKHRALLNIQNKTTKHFIIQLLHPFTKSFSGTRSGKFSDVLRKINKYGKVSKLNLENRYLTLASFTDEKIIDSLLINSKTHLDLKNYLKNLNSDFNSVLNTDLNLVLSNDMLIKADSMSMANSLEVRVPFVYTPLINFLSSLPSSFKCTSSNGKQIFKDAFKDLIPESIINRSKKGFEIPLKEVLNTPIAIEILKNITANNKNYTGDYFSKEILKQLPDKISKTDSPETNTLAWSLIVFANWHNKHFANA